MIYNHGDSTIAKTWLFDLFLSALKHRYNTECIQKRVQEASDILQINISTKDDDANISNIANEAEKLFRKTGYMLDFDDIEINYIYSQYQAVCDTCTEEEIEDMIEDIYNLPAEIRNEEIDKYNKRYNK